MPFFSHKALSVHLEEKHKRDNTFTCSFKTCDREFATVQELKKHQTECSLAKAQLFFGIKPPKPTEDNVDIKTVQKVFLGAKAKRRAKIATDTIAKADYATEQLSLGK